MRHPLNYDARAVPVKPAGGWATAARRIRKQAAGTAKTVRSKAQRDLSLTVRAAELLPTRKARVK